MEIKVEKLTDKTLLDNIVKFCWGVDSKASLNKWYRSEHSPVYSQIFVIYCKAPKSVMEQIRTHEKNGMQVFSSSGRPDTGNESGNDRDSERSFVILCNAMHLIRMSHKRLCNKAEENTQLFMRLLFKEMFSVDEELSMLMVPKCKYLKSGCNEFKSCKELK